MFLYEREHPEDKDKGKDKSLLLQKCKRTSRRKEGRCILGYYQSVVVLCVMVNVIESI